MQGPYTITLGNENKGIYCQIFHNRKALSAPFTKTDDIFLLNVR